MIISVILLFILIFITLNMMFYLILSEIRMYMFNKRLVPGTYITHHYKKDDFTPVKHEKYYILDRSKKQIKVQDEDGYVFVKTVSLMSPEDYSFE